MEIVDSYKFLGVHINNRLDWKNNTDAVYRKGQSCMYFLWRLISFNVCSRLLPTFYHFIMASTQFFAVMCWGGGTKDRKWRRVNKLVRKASTVMGLRRIRDELKNILKNPSYPIYQEL